MNLASHIYRSALDSGNGLKARCSGRLRRWLLRFGDPDCVMEVHGRALSMPLSHLLPWHRRNHRCYDSLLERLSGYLRERDGALRAIDVGANIGDTVAAFHLEADDAVLAIEPAPGFFRFLQQNWGKDERVTLLEAICSSGNEDGGYVIAENDGTARVRKEGVAESLSIPVRPLDQIVADDPKFSEPNLIKIDTDGHDFEVLAGSAGVIARSKPAVFFECDAFDNPDYLRDFRESIERFREAGYFGMLVYDNFGYLMGRYSLDQIDAFEPLLAYQVTSEFYYFDVLMIESRADLDALHEAEFDFFAQRVDDPKMRASLSLRPHAGGTRKEPGNAVELAS